MSKKIRGIAATADRKVLISMKELTEAIAKVLATELQKIELPKLQKTASELKQKILEVLPAEEYLTPNQTAIQIIRRVRRVLEEY